MRHPERDTEYPYKWSVQNLFIHLLILCGSSHYKSISIFFNFQTTELHETKIRKAFVISLRPHDVIFSNQGLTIPFSPRQTFASEDHYVRWKETETLHTRANRSRQEKYTVLSADKVEE